MRAIKIMPMAQGKWRRGWDSNPRYGLSPYNGLANPTELPLFAAAKPVNADTTDKGPLRNPRFTREMLGLASSQESAQGAKAKTVGQLLSRYQVAPSGCHEWTGSTNGKGYGVLLISIDGKKRLLLAHRLQWMQYHGQIPKGLVIMHHCDNTRCINIDHLQAGTQRENLQDMIAKGRQNWRGLLAQAAQNRAQRKRR